MALPAFPDLPSVIIPGVTTGQSSDLADTYAYLAALRDEVNLKLASSVAAGTYGALANLTLNLKASGAKGDGRRVVDGAMGNGSAVLTSATAAFTAADVGKVCHVGDNGGTGIVTAVASTIISYQSATQVTLAGTAPHALTAVTVDCGTDDSALLQSLIDLKAASGGGVIVVPDGTYFCNCVLKGGVTLKGESEFFGYLPSNVYGVKFLAVTSAPVVDTPATNIRVPALKGINIDGAGIAGVGVRFRDVTWAAIKSVNVNNCLDQGFLFAAGNSLVAEDVLIANCLLTRSRGSIAGAFEVYGADHFISRIEATPSLTALTDANMRNRSIYLGCTNSAINTIIGEIGDVGVYLTGNYNKLVNARGDLCWGHGWEITGDKNSLSSCHGVGCGRQTVNTYDHFKVTGRGNSFAACRSVHTGAFTVKYGFEDTIALGPVNLRNSYDASTGGDGATAPFLGQAYAGSGRDYPPHDLHPADGATTWDATGTSLIVTELYVTDTTVTAITGTQGQTIRVVGDANVTIANNSTIKTNTGANKTLAANQVYTFTLTNGVWRESGVADVQASQPRVQFYYYGADGGADTTNALVASTVYYVPVLLSGKAIDKLALEVTVAAAGGKLLNLGIYSVLSTGMPGAKLVELPAPVAADAVAGPSGTIAYNPGTSGQWVYLASISDGTPTVRAVTAPVRGMPRASSTTGAPRGSWSEAGATTVLPTNASAGVAASGNAPNVLVRVA